MKHVKLFEEYVDEALNATAKKEFERLGAGFEADEEIADAILKCGFKKLPSPSKTAEHVFLDPKRGVKYTSSSKGYVRYYDPEATQWRTGEPITTRTPIHKDTIETTRERLLLILRRAMKAADIYKEWKSSPFTGKEFFEKTAHILTAKKYGL